jgi:hypothetical protein
MVYSDEGVRPPERFNVLMHEPAQRFHKMLAGGLTMPQATAEQQQYLALCEATGSAVTYCGGVVYQIETPDERRLIVSIVPERARDSREVHGCAWKAWPDQPITP